MNNPPPPSRIPKRTHFPELSLGVENSSSKEFLRGCLFYILMLSGVVPYLFPFLAVIARKYYRKQVLQDKILNPPTDNDDAD